MDLQLGSERFRAPEILFDPEIIGLEYPGIHHIIVDSINRTDLDLRKALFGNLVLSGGSTLTKGLTLYAQYTPSLHTRSMCSVLGLISRRNF